MRCYICDKVLSEKEMVYNEELSQYEPCTECLEIILDAAYSDGFTTEDDDFVLLSNRYTDGDASDVVQQYLKEEYE